MCGFGQNVDSRMRLAKTLEKNHNYEEALKIYKILDNDKHTNPTIINGIKNCLRNLMKYDELIEYLESVIVNKKKQTNLMLELGEAYLLSDKKEKALKIWNQLISEQKANINIYRKVASSMIRQRMFDDAIAVYQQALKSTKGQHYFHLDIANLYRARFDLAKATEHYLTYYKNYPKQSSHLQRQILNLTKLNQQVEQVAAVLKNYIKTNKDQHKVTEILGGLYIKTRNFSEAYEVYQTLEKNKQKGTYLYKFGKEAQKNKAYDYAIKAFNDIIHSKKNQKKTSSVFYSAQFELAKTFYYLAIQNQKGENLPESAKNIKQSIALFESLKQKNNLKYFSDHSSLFLGNIYKEYYFDIDKAIDYFNFIVTNFKRSKIRNIAIINLGDSHLIKGDLNKAEQTYNQIKENKGVSVAKFRLAEIEFYRGNFSQAKKIYGQIIEINGLSDSLANNSLERNILLDSFISDSVRLKNYANAELLIFQKKYSEAIESLRELIIPECDFATIAGKIAVKYLIRLNKLLDASNLLTEIINQFPDDYHLDDFIFILAGVQEKMGNLQKSFDLYQKILTEFGSSLHYEEARVKARELNEKIKDPDVTG